MVIVPSSNIVLLKTPMELGDDNQLTWSTKQEQYNYFNSLPKLLLDDATYQRKDNEIRFPTSSTITYEDLIQYNYCMYQNEAYDDKWFYAYITEINYINDGMSTIKIETDVWNTWCFDITLKQSFVEREHVNDDTIGLHTIPEGLETGGYFPSDYSIMNYGTLYANPYYVCVGITENILDNTSPILLYNRVYSGIQYLVIRDESSLTKFINKYDNAGKNEAIVCLFMIPGAFIDLGHAINWSVEDNIYYTTISTGEDATSIKDISLSRPAQIGISSNKYIPKNNKLFTGEYMYLLLDNMSGSVAKYDYEYFSNPQECNFHCIGAITPGCSLQTFPANYKGIPNNISEGLLNAKLPICSWNSDIYTNWLTQNGVNIGISLATSGLQIIGGALISSTGAGSVMGASQMTSGALNIANTLGQVYEHSLAPNQAQGNINNGDVIFANNRIYPTFYKMSIKEEYAKIIDDYFSMYGYKVNSLKVPNIRGRRNWNYVKTIGCNITGDIPQIDLEKIRNQFDKGVTFWHHSNTFLDYSQTNDII